jgi:hypothetical protein
MTTWKPTTSFDGNKNATLSTYQRQEKSATEGRNHEWLSQC